MLQRHKPYNQPIQPESGRANELSMTASDMSSKSGRQSFIFNEPAKRSGRRRSGSEQRDASVQSDEES
ncbi:unnamed protein product [Merluccius merluccius]